MSKKLIAFLTALSLCLSMTACGSSDKDLEKKPDNESGKSVEEQFEKSYADELKKAEEADENNKAKDEKITFEPSEEILNADLGSGKVQIGDDIFCDGGYMTVGEFVEKYKDKYVVLSCEQLDEKVDYCDIFDPNCDFAVNSYYIPDIIICRKDIFEKQKVTEEDDGTKIIDEPTDDFFSITLTLDFPADFNELEDDAFCPVNDAEIIKFSSPNGICFYPKDIKHKDSAYFQELSKYKFDDMQEYFNSLNMKSVEDYYDINLTRFSYDTVLYKDGAYYKDDNEYMPDYWCYFTSTDKNYRGAALLFKYHFIFDEDTKELKEVNILDEIHNVDPDRLQD